LKKLKGVVTVSLLYSFLTPLSAENDALHKATSAKQNTMMVIPWPPSGSSFTSNGFNLQITMHLEDDPNKYTALHLS